MPTASEIVARLTLNAKDFTAKFDAAIDQATTRARAGGAQVGRAFGETASDGLRQFAGQVPAVGGALTGLNGAALGAAAGVGALTVAVGFAVAQAEEYARATRGLEAVLKATGNQTGLTTDQLKEFASQQETALSIAEESIIGAEKVLSSFDGVAGTTFKRAIIAAADLSAVYGGDLSSNAEKLGVVLQNLAQGNVEGLAKGFKFLGTATIETISALAKAGDTAAAQRALLDALEQKVGGTAAATGKGVAGAFFRLSDTLGDTARHFSDVYGISNLVVRGLDAATAAANAFSSSLDGLNKIQLTGEIFKLLNFGVNPIAATANLITTKIGGQLTGSTARDAAGAAARDNILALESQRQKADQDRAAAASAARAKAEGDAQRATEAAAEAAKKAATEHERAATAAEAAAKAIERQRAALAQSIDDLEFQAKVAGLTRDEAEKLTAIRSRELQFGKLLSANDKERIARAIELRQINAAGRAADDAALQNLKDTPNLLDQIIAQQAKKDAAAAAGQAELTKKQEANFRYLSDSFYDVFSGRSGNIWSKFKELGARTLAELAAQFVLTGNINLGGTSGGGLIGSLLGGAAGGSGGLLNAGLSGLGVAGGLSGALGGLLGSTGLGAVTIGAGAASAAGVGALGGTTLATAGAGASGLLGAAAPLLAAAPWLAAIAGLGALAAAIIPGVTPRAFESLTVDQSGLAVGGTSRARGKGQDANLAKASSLSDAFTSAFKSLSDSLGAKLTPGASLGEIGFYKGQYAYNQTVGDGGRLALSDTPEGAVTAGLQSLFQRGLVTGVDAGVSRLLSSGDFAAQSAKAVLLSNALKQFNTAANPMADAVKALNDQFTQLRDVMAEAGSSAEDVAKASALYDTKLQAIRDSSGQATTTLQSFLDSLGFGSNSPLSLGDQLAAAQANYSAKAAGIGTAGFDQQAFVSAGQSLLGLTGQANGRTQDFFTVFNQVQADTNRAIGAITNASGITGDNPFARATADNTAATADNTAALLAEMQALNDNFAGLATQFATGFIGGDVRGFKTG